MAKAAGKTGSGPISIVAIEQYFPQEERIIVDNLAHRLIPSGGVFLKVMRLNSVRDWMVKITEKTFPGLWSCMMCRKKYIDEKLIDSVNDIEAVVNLGAGFDTRSFRLQELSHVPVWELDQPTNIETKKTQLGKIFASIPSNVKLVSIDFDHEDISTILYSYGYSIYKKTFFIWEGVTQYLTEDGIRATFDFLAKAAPGSRLAFTYVLKDFIEGRNMYGWDKMYKDYVTNNIWLFGMEPETWPNFLKEYGWQVIEDISYEEIAQKYVKPTGRKLASTPVERMIYVEKL
ncbi:SAM-dependent methyltransferase [Clostridium beijerinckii]|uniref:SAM-dependent methyltransferase n=1 Tax=Clostridium beijerinckii TaxID=1520 RepID=UPI000479C1C0|nr:SAM-dependent methyltransferase [Clostridium beijerinckii]